MAERPLRAVLPLFPKLAFDPPVLHCRPREFDFLKLPKEEVWMKLPSSRCPEAEIPFPWLDLEPGQLLDPEVDELEEMSIVSFPMG